MSNRRRIRRKPGEPMPTLPRYPHKAPALSTVRGWLRQLEDAGLAERKDVAHTGKPGRPATLWGLTDKGVADAANKPPRSEPPTRDEARRLLDEASRAVFGISGRQFVRRLDAGFYQCGWKCRCDAPHDPELRGLLRIAAWSRMSVASVSRTESSVSD